jgi:hypothetical protein
VGATINAVDNWKPSGNLYFWRYLENARNYPGWHFALDPAAVGSLSLLFDAMAKANSASYRTLRVVPPTLPLLMVPNNKNGSAKWQSPAKLRITFSPSNAAAWSFTGDSQVVDWSIGKAHVPIAVDAFRDPSKYFDTTIGNDPGLWSWGVFVLPNKSVGRTGGK